MREDLAFMTKAEDLEFMSEKLKTLRFFKKKTQREVAEAIGITVGAYNAYEVGIRKPADETKKAISQYFGVPVQDIFFPYKQY